MRKVSHVSNAAMCSWFKTRSTSLAPNFNARNGSWYLTVFGSLKEATNTRRSTSDGIADRDPCTNSAQVPLTPASSRFSVIWYAIKTVSDGQFLGEIPMSRRLVTSILRPRQAVWYQQKLNSSTE